MMLPTADGFDAMTASAREARDLGVDTVLVRPSALDIGADDLDEFLTWLVGLDGRRD